MSPATQFRVIFGQFGIAFLSFLLLSCQLISTFSPPQRERTLGETCLTDENCGDGLLCETGICTSLEADGDADGDMDEDSNPDADGYCGDGLQQDGEECDNTESRECATSCGTTGTQACVDCSWDTDCRPPPDVCNDTDDDCNPETPDGSGDPRLGNDCDGTDADHCDEGALECVSGELRCNDETENNLERCNDEDDDCDPATVDGAGETWFDRPCDGVDEDLCMNGTYRCEGGEQRCSDSAETILDICNAFDDDCDPLTPDGAHEEWFGERCDGPDDDLCEEGEERCHASSRACTDFTGDNEETCNGEDDDCDGGVDEDFTCRLSDTTPCTTECGGMDGERICVETCTWGDCHSEEHCNGCDDDGDGDYDEGCACADGWAWDNPLPQGNILMSVRGLGDLSCSALL